MPKCETIRRNIIDTRKVLVGIEELSTAGYYQADSFEGNVLLISYSGAGKIAISDFSSFAAGSKVDDQIAKMLDWVKDNCNNKECNVKKFTKTLNKPYTINDVKNKLKDYCNPR